MWVVNRQGRIFYCPPPSCVVHHPESGGLRRKRNDAAQPDLGKGVQGDTGFGVLMLVVVNQVAEVFPCSCEEDVGDPALDLWGVGID